MSEAIIVDAASLTEISALAHAAAPAAQEGRTMSTITPDQLATEQNENGRPALESPPPR